jgi:hypothetical protein
MTDDNNTDHLDQTDEQIFTFTLPDEALEAAAHTEGGALFPAPLLALLLLAISAADCR